MPKKDEYKKLKLKLTNVKPLTKVQKSFFAKYKGGKSQVLMGSAGTGKTFLSLFKAFEELKKNPEEIRQVVIVRSAVATRDIGHLPGTLEEKQEIYELPYKSICTELFNDPSANENMKSSGVLKFMLTSYVRGITLDNTLVIVDEFQNMTAHEADSIITRLGKFSRILFCGDIFQTDFTRQGEKNIGKFISVIESMGEWFDINTFQVDDIVRGELVKAYIKAKDFTYRDGY